MVRIIAFHIFYMGPNLYNYNRQITIKSQLDHIYPLFFYLYDRSLVAGRSIAGAG